VVGRAASDIEHTGRVMDAVRMVLATAGATDTVPIVRVPVTECHFVERVLGLVVAVVMAPMVESGDQVR
jgi:2-keto-3-deoxy-L-rhamnonate aldolase RhmA